MSYLRDLMAANVEGWPDNPAEQDKEIELVKQNPKYLADLMRGSVEGFSDLNDADQSAEMSLALLEHDRSSLAEKQPILEAQQAQAVEGAKQADVPLAEGVTPSSVGQTIKSLGSSVIKSIPELANQVFVGGPEVVARAIGDTGLAEYIGKQKAANTAWLNEALPTPNVVPPLEQQWEAGGAGTVAALPLTAAQAIAPMTAKLALTAGLTPVVGPTAAGTIAFGGTEVPAAVQQATEMGGDTKSMVALGATKAMLNGLIFSVPITRALGPAAPMKATLWNFVKKSLGEIPRTAGTMAPAIVVTTAIDKGVENFIREKDLSEDQGNAIKDALFNSIPMTVGFAGLHAAKAMGEGKPKELPPVEKMGEAPRFETPKEPVAPPVPEAPKTPEQEKLDYTKKQFEDLGLVDQGPFDFNKPPTMEPPKTETPPVAEPPKPEVPTAEPKAPEPPKQEIPPVDINAPEPTPPGQVLGGVIDTKKYENPNFLAWAKAEGKEPTPTAWARFNGREPTNTERYLTRFREVFPTGAPETSAALTQITNIVNEKPIENWAQRRGVQTNAETQRLAEQRPLSFEEMMEIKPGTALNAEQATQLTNTTAKFAVALHDASVDFAANPTSENMAKVKALETMTQQLALNNIGVTSEAGRSLQAVKMAARQNKIYTDLVDLMTAKIKDPEKAKDIWDKWYELYISSLLSGVQTQTSNITGNTAYLLAKPFEMGISSAISGGKSVHPSEMVGWSFGLLSGIQNSARLATEALADIYKSESPVRETYAKLRSVQDQGSVKLEQAPNRTPAIEGLTGEIIRTPLSLLSLADIVHKSWVSSAESSREAYHIASNEGLKWGTPEFNARVKSIVANPEQALGEERGGEFKDRAAKMATHMTYADKMGPFMQNILKLRNTPGPIGFAAKILMPFVSVTANIGKATMRMTPLNFLRVGYKYSKGQLEGREVSNELAKPILGSVIGATAVMAAMNGQITGFGPKDPGKRKVWLLNHSPYSVNTPWGSASYDKLEPIGSIVGMAADMVEMAKGEDDKTYGDYAKHFMLSIGSNLANKSFVRGISTLMQAWTDPERYGESFLETLGSSAVPGGGALNSIRKAVDPNARVTNGVPEAMMNRLPFASEHLLPRRDVFGNPISLGPNAFARSVSPMKITVKSLDPANTWVEKMGIEIGYPGRSATVRGKKIDFDPIQQDLLISQSGKEIYNYINRVRNNFDPNKATPQVKERVQKIVGRAVMRIRERIAHKLIRDVFKTVGK